MQRFLQQISAFSELGDEELQLLAEAAVEKPYAKSDRIIRKGDPGSSMYIIRTGAVSVVEESSNGSLIELATFRSGEFFGEMSLFDGKPRSATVVAEDDSVVVEISRESFLKIVFRKPEVALKIIAEVSNRFRKTDEIVKAYSDRIYREAYSSVEKVLRTELESAKTIYSNIEKTSLATVEHVERSWKTLVRIISAITIVFSGLGSIAVFWGYNTYEDISEKSEKIEVLTKKSNIIVEKAKENLDALSNTKVLREVQYDLENVRQQLFLDLQDEKIKDMSLDNWWSGLILYREAIENLKGYIANPEPGKHEPESVLKAIDIILELSQQNILPLDAKGLLEIHKSLLALARAGVGDWRVRREIASKAETLGKLAKGTLATAKQEILRDWRDLFINMPLNNRFRINVAMILSSLGDWSNDIKHLFLEILSDRRERKWSKRNAAISLIEIGRNEEGFDYLVKESEKMDIDGLWSSIYIARLTRGEIEKITTLPSLGKRIIEKLGYVKRYTPDRLNFFLEGYALKISQCLSEGNTPPDCRNRHW